jgi:4'-phosphopantetheinyl transferase EntD
VSTIQQYTRNPATVSADLARLFPTGVVVAELRQAGDARLLLPAEAPFVRQAVPKRVQEFAAGRLCARRAMEQFGVTGFPLSVGADRQPLWPDGLIGSITHTAGYCAAAVAERERLIALGVDSETVGDVTPDIWPTICGGSEAEWLRSLPGSSQDAAITLIFSAKEAFYKCQFPLTHEWLDFHDLIVEPLAWRGDAGSGARSGATGNSVSGSVTEAERGAGGEPPEVLVRATRPLAFLGHARLPMIGRYRFHEGFVTVGFGVPA